MIYGREENNRNTSYHFVWRHQSQLDLKRSWRLYTWTRSCVKRCTEKFGETGISKLAWQNPNKRNDGRGNESPAGGVRGHQYGITKQLKKPNRDLFTRQCGKHLKRATSRSCQCKIDRQLQKPSWPTHQAQRKKNLGLTVNPCIKNPGYNKNVGTFLRHVWFL